MIWFGIWSALKAFLDTKLGRIVVGCVFLFLIFLYWLHKHDERVIEEQTRQESHDVQQRDNEAARNRDKLPLNPDGVQQNDGRCRDCGVGGVP